MAVRAASATHTPIDTVMGWAWHKMLFAWAEGRDIHAETWGLLLRVHYRFETDA